MPLKVFGELLARRPRGLLYHYTNQEGLLGIFGSAEIWATQVRYLNDASEFRHAFDLAAEIADEIVRTAAGQRKKLAQQVANGIRGAGINICVASFSERGDDLSQWRAYSQGGVGYSLGFHYDDLEEAIKTSGWMLTPCIYDPKEQRNLLTKLIETALEENAQADTKFDDEIDSLIQEHGGNIGFYLNRYAAIFKNQHFGVEQEWRLISAPMSSAQRLFAFRAGGSTIIPYYRLPLARNEKGTIKLRKIVVGPGPSSELATAAVRSLVASRRTSVDVVSSAIPYRNW